MYEIARLGALQGLDLNSAKKAALETGDHNCLHGAEAAKHAAETVACKR